MDLKEVEILGEAIAGHWYFRSKRAALLRLVDDLGSRRALDVGAGSGFFARALLERTAVETVTCVDPNYDAESDGTVADKPIRFRREAAAGDADLIVLMDVLEHVERDVALLAGYAEGAGPGTDFIISVPAMQWLWSGHDVFLDHHRRYTLGEIAAVARTAGLEVVEGMYYFGAVLPLAAVARVPGILSRLRGRPPEPRSSLRRHAAPVNAALTALCRAELPLMRHNRLAGLTVFLHARKGG